MADLRLLRHADPVGRRPAGRGRRHPRWQGRACRVERRADRRLRPPRTRARADPAASLVPRAVGRGVEARAAGMEAGRRRRRRAAPDRQHLGDAAVPGSGRGAARAEGGRLPALHRLEHRRRRDRRQCRPARRHHRSRDHRPAGRRLQAEPADLRACATSRAPGRLNRNAWNRRSGAGRPTSPARSRPSSARRAGSATGIR